MHHAMKFYRAGDGRVDCASSRVYSGAAVDAVNTISAGSAYRAAEAAKK